MTVEVSRSVSVAEAKAHLSELIAAAEAGERIEITRRGKAVAVLVPKAKVREPITMEFFEEITANMTSPEVDSVDLIRKMRDDARY